MFYEVQTFARRRGSLGCALRFKAIDRRRKAAKISANGEAFLYGKFPVVSASGQGLGQRLKVKWGNSFAFWRENK